MTKSKTVSKQIAKRNFLSTYLQTGFVSSRRIYLKQTHFKESASKLDDDVRKSAWKSRNASTLCFITLFSYLLIVLKILKLKKRSMDKYIPVVVVYTCCTV